MALTVEIMARLLPANLPPWAPSGDTEERKAEQIRRRDGGEGPFTRAYFWQKHLTARLREATSWLSDSFTGLGYPNPLLEQAVGFIEMDAALAADPDIRIASRETGYVFGAVLYDHRGNAEAFDRTWLDFTALDDHAAGIPAVRVPAADIPHAPHPIGATASCWARSTAGGRAVDRIVTAKHAIAGLHRGQRVAMSGGGFGILEDYCESSVDAALIRLASQAGAPVPIAMDIDPAIGTDIHFTGAGNAQRTGKITKTWIHLGNSDPYDPQRAHFDVLGVAGESGALVRATSSGHAVGIYTGIKAGASTSSGMAQAIWQATDLLSIELYA